VIGSPLLSTLIPFSPNLVADAQTMLQLDFMRSAFVAGTVTAVVAGLVGYFVVLRHLAFAGDALSHVAFAGSLGALVAGLNPLLGLFGLTALAGLGMGVLGTRARARDEAVGTLLAWVLGLGVLFLSLITSRSSASNGTIGVNVLFGSIFGLSVPQVHMSVLAAVVAIPLVLALARPLLFASIDPDVAAARGVPVRALGVGFLVLVGIAVAEAVPALGALMVFALLITPAAIAQRLERRPFRALFLAAAISVLFTWVGLTVAFYLPLPVSFVISALAFVGYVGVVVWQAGTHGLVSRSPVTGAFTEPR